MLRLHDLVEPTRVLHATAVSDNQVVVLTQDGAAVWGIADNDVVVQETYDLPQRVCGVLTYDHHNQTSVLITDHAPNIAYCLCFVQLASGHTSQHVIERPDNPHSGAPAPTAACICFSNTFVSKCSFSCTHFAASVYQGWVHVVSAYEWSDPHRRKLFISMHSFAKQATGKCSAGRHWSLFSCECCLIMSPQCSSFTPFMFAADYRQGGVNTKHGVYAYKATGNFCSVDMSGGNSR